MFCSLTLLMPGRGKEPLLGGVSEEAGLVMSFGSLLVCCSGDTDPLCWRDISNRIAVVEGKGSGHTGAVMGMERESVWCQGRSSGLAPLRHLVCPVTRSEVTSPPGTSVLPRLSSERRRILSSSITRSRPALGSCGLQAAAWTRNRHSKGHQPSLGDRGPKLAYLPFPGDGDHGGGGGVGGPGGQPFHR